MTDSVPGYVSIVFILTTFAVVGMFLHTAKRAAFDKLPTKLLGFLLAFQIFFQAAAATTGIYMGTDFPPRLILFGVLPALAAILLYLAFFRAGFVERLSLENLTFIHAFRIPVELVLLWLFRAQLVPQSMTFEGRNFDILAGLTAPLVWFLAFRGENPNRTLLIVWNILALGLLANIVATAVVSFPAFAPNAAPELQNRAVALFPYVWLPTVVVPIVLFCHLASLWRLLLRRT